MDESARIDSVEEHYRMVRLDQEKEKQRRLEDAILTIEGIVQRRERRITESKKIGGDRVRAIHRTAEIEETISILEAELE